jgi:uncharacterized protein YraI
MKHQPQIVFALLVLAFGVFLVSTAFAQGEMTGLTTAILNLRAGPGRDQPDIGSLPNNASIVLEGRNEAGDWLLVHMPDTAIRGWIAGAYVTPQNDARTADLPITTELMSAVQYSVMDQLRVTPVVPYVTGSARTIYEQGLALGNHPNRFSKVGDCQNIPEFFLGGFDRGEYTLGDYGELQATIDFFAGSFERNSMAVSPGFNVYAVLDPAWSVSPCENGESPQECEYRLWRPSFVIVSLEITSGITVEGYEAALREILDFWTANGVVPILGTKADNREGDWSFNATIARVAWEYDVPLWNFLMAAQPLPDYGLEDGFHLTFAPNDFGNTDNMQSAWPWRNLTALQALGVMRRGLG